MSQRHINILKAFTGGLNQDDDVHLIPRGDYLDAQNVRISKVGEEGIVENVLGNSVITNSDLPAGTNTTIGSVYDPNLNSVIFFVKNSNNDHTIFEYSIDGGTFNILYQDAILNFDARIEAKVVNNFLIWNDRVQPPRKLNLDYARTQPGQRAWKLYFGKFKYYNNSGDLVQSAFQLNSVYEWSFGGGGATFTSGSYGSIQEAVEAVANNISANSDWSGYTAVAKDDYVLVTESGVQNEIEAAVTVSTITNQTKAWVTPYNYISDYSDIKNIEFQRRKPLFAPEWDYNIYNPQGLTGDTVSNSLAKRSLQFSMSYVFRDKSESVLSEFSIHKPADFDDGTKVEQYNQLIVNVVQSLINVNERDFLRDLESVNIYFREGNDGNLKLWRTISQGEIFPDSRDLTQIGFYFWNYSIGTATSIDKSSKTFESVPISVGAIEAIFTDNGTVLSLGDLTENYDYAPIQGGCTVEFSSYLTSGVNTDYTRPEKYFKRGGRYKLGVIFFDEFGRNSGVSTNLGFDIYVPRKTEDVGDTAIPGTSSSGYQREGAYISWSLTQDPSNIPNWAYSYQLAITDNLNFGFFRQFSPRNVKAWNVISDSEVTLPTSLQNGEYRIFIDNLEEKWGDAYTFAKGDKLRVIQTRVGGSLVYADDIATGAVSGEMGVAEFEILGAEADYIRITKNSRSDNVFEDVFSEDRTTAATRMVIEIYRPSVSSEDLFFGFGEVYEITNPTASNRSFSTASADTRAGEGIGDSYVRFVGDANISSPDDSSDTTISASTNVFIETQNRDLSEQSLNWDWDKGRANVYLPNNTQIRDKSTIRISNQITADGSTNEIFSFDALSKVVLPNEFGEIEKIIRVGDVLLVIHRNNRTVSLYLQKVTSVDANGVVLAAFSDALIGGRNVLTAEYGTQHPETVVKNDGYVYWVDANKNAVIRYSSNGFSKISSFKMESFFDQALLDITPSDYMLGVFDYENYEYRLLGDWNEDCISFSEEDGRWLEFLDWAPEQAINAGGRLFSFLNGAMWLEGDATADRNSFFGVSKESVIKFTAAENPMLEKVFLSITENATDVWEVESVTNDEGQLTAMLSGVFKLQENNYYAPVRRDRNTPFDKNGNSISAEVAEIIGNPIRTTCAVFTLTNTNSNEVKLRGVIIKAVPSNRSTI